MSSASIIARCILVCVLATPFGTTGNLGAQSLTWTGGPQLVNPSLSGEFYEYAPSAMVDPTDSSITDVWSCHNPQAGVIQDNIFYSQATSSGVSTEYSVLAPSSGNFDSWNTCDPSVVSSNVTYNGTAYQYVMFYTGNDCGSQHNQIGMAFSQSPTSSFTKLGSAPVISYSAPNQCTLGGDWGVGQPSVTSIDGEGRFLVFYTVGTGEDATIANGIVVSSGCYAYVSEVDYVSSSNTASIAWTNALPTSGLSSSDCGLHNYDVVYSAANDTFYAVGQDAAAVTYFPTFISDHLNLYSLPGTNVWNGGGSWTYLGTITPATTGYSRNHDAGLLRTIYGELPTSGQITVMGTNGCESTSTGGGSSTGPCNNNFSDPQSWLATYRLYTMTGIL